MTGKTNKNILFYCFLRLEAFHYTYKQSLRETNLCWCQVWGRNASSFLKISFKILMMLAFETPAGVLNIPIFRLSSSKKNYISTTVSIKIYMRMSMNVFVCVCKDMIPITTRYVAHNMIFTWLSLCRM